MRVDANGDTPTDVEAAICHGGLAILSRVGWHARQAGWAKQWRGLWPGC